MLRVTKEIIGYKILSEEGTIGKCKDFLIDDRQWTIRYVVIDTGKWLPDRQVIIAPSLVGDPDWKRQMLPILLTKEELENSPPISNHEPVSRRYETLWLEHFKQPVYFAPVPPVGLPVAAELPSMTSVNRNKAKQLAQESDNETHLRSIKEIVGYDIHAQDGDIGVVGDFIMDDTTWTLKYIIVSKRKWLPSEKIIQSIDWIKNVNWPRQTVELNTTVNEIENGPLFDPFKPINREYEVRLYDYYGRPKYWTK